MSTRNQRQHAGGGGLEGRVAHLETAVGGLQEMTTAMDGKLDRVLSQVAGLSAGSDRLPKDFVSSALTITIAMATLMLAAIGSAAGLGAFFVNLQVQRLDSNTLAVNEAVKQETAARMVMMERVIRMETALQINGGLPLSQTHF